MRSVPATFRRSAVYNKIDRLETPPRIDRGEDGLPTAVWISAQGQTGLEDLLRSIAERLSRAVRRMRLQLPLTAGAARARLYAAGVVLNEVASEEVFDLTVDLPDEEISAIERLPGATVSAVPAGGP